MKDIKRLIDAIKYPEQYVKYYHGDINIDLIEILEDYDEATLNHEENQNLLSDLEDEVNYLKDEVADLKSDVERLEKELDDAREQD